MNSVIIKPGNEILKRYVQYFLFFNKMDERMVNYTTFPNNNLCLAIYKQNEVHYVNDQQSNSCIITVGDSNFVSRCYGFHKMPFQVNVNSPLDQVCIVFYPAALGAFTSASYEDLMSSNHVFETVFPDKNTFFLEQLFAEQNFAKRAQRLESLLLNNLNDCIPNRLKDALLFISNGHQENPTVEDLARKLRLSETSVFRLFKNHLGQNPKSFLKTIRFRTALDKMLSKECSLTETAYLNQYYDQAHLIKDFRSLSGHSPKQLLGKVALSQNDLVWICDGKFPE
ncbi:helix-turn-helix domain-containing protein [Pedobacter gandavensis]|uniref:Helix-turn-helix domain-containing protein n=1 Tax=Pedobacter gandavensis TaxID=2679963 RepID=A0ABR6ETS0_9SPHI|nr:AraC family transcriptional regulator [Pedobacter gandavensis]MBB2148214.1 helix-turn-helix domain-containing protein [Pedobacter gandavensis]